VTVPSTKPAFWIAVVAAACVCPTTLGTATGAGPEETTKFTAEPGATGVPAAGFSLMTLPAGTLLLEAVVTVPSTKPAFWIAVVAAACVCPTTLGTATGAGPEETTKFTAEPGATGVPAPGFSLMTLPAGTLLLEAVVTVPSTSRHSGSRWSPPPALVQPHSEQRAPTVPDETTRSTDTPKSKDVPAAGLSLMTLPAGTVGLFRVRHRTHYEIRRGNCCIRRRLGEPNYIGNAGSQ